ncbi:MAG: hypothetical protein AAF922_05865 [Pseudomonadota bacterium]
MKAALATGLDVGAVEVAPDGTIRVMVGAPSAESQDAMTPFDEWKAKTDARKT